jgi:hypothetical protein
MLVRAIQKTRPIAYRTKVLGRVLLAVRTYANSFWMLVSGNAKVAFPSTTVTIEAATNPSTLYAYYCCRFCKYYFCCRFSPTAAAAPTGSVSALEIVATPTAGRKREARP